MGKIHAMMDIGKRSMMNSQTSLQTVSHNIANKTTEGYSRQRVELKTAVPITEGRLQIGMGSRAAQVTRVNSPFLEKTLQKENNQMGFLNGQAEPLAKIENIFNEQQNKGLNQYMTDFFNAYRELANTPESVTTRTMVKEAASALVGDFQRVDRQLTDVQTDVDLEINGHVAEINKMTKEIADLNQQIVQTEMIGNPANDQRDRRDLLIKKLGEKIDVKVAEGDKGSITVSTAGNALLVTGLDYTKLETFREPDSNRLLIYNRVSEGHPPYEITDRIKGGQIGGMLKVRDEVIDTFRSRIDDMAYTLTNEVNKAHLEGVDRDGRMAQEFFNFMADPRGAAKNISLNSVIENDVTRISAGSRDAAPGDSSVANVISVLQYRQVMDEGTSTLDDVYNSQVGRVGVIAQAASKSRDNQIQVLQQANTLRDSISGVSLDEEATNMIEFQKAFDASARLIRTADEMFDTVLSLKRM